ncbi:restriction endonuclease subunit S, partial [Jeotgalibaca porci]|uniref:restriction endonuclease subunit S n=1 Tax=Jeotgalibaca porci TaxID=1868793 RepID=UPI00359F4D53
KHLEAGDIPVYGTGGYMLSVNDKLSDRDAIGLGRKGTIDKPQYLKAPFWTVDTLFYMIPKVNFDLLFLYSMTQKINWKRMDESTGVPSLSKAVIEKVKQRVPNIDEQSKIGKLFKQIDNTIALHQRKLEQLQSMKDGFLQKMFPIDGEKEPEIRFPGFTDDWEQRKLGDITESYSGGTPSASNKTYYGGAIPFVRSGEINDSSTELFVTEEGLNNSSAKMVTKGDILYALYGATSGEVGISQINGAINQAILAIRPTKGDDSYLISQWLKKQKNVIISTYLQGGQGNLSGNIVKNLHMILPSDIDEQRKISTFFKSLDATITLHQRELELLKQTKKAFLQKMFV